MPQPGMMSDSWHHQLIVPFPPPLAARAHWVLTGRVSAAAAFGTLAHLVGDATLLWLCGQPLGGRLDRDLGDAIEWRGFGHWERTPEPDTPVYVADYRGIRPSPQVWRSLVRLVSEDASEVGAHLFVYQDAAPLAEWHDGFEPPLLLAARIPEPAVTACCRALGMSAALNAPAA